MDLSIKQILIGRFLLSPHSPTTYIIAPAVWKWANENEYPVDPLTSTIARANEWDRCRNLEYVILNIIREKDLFSTLLLEMIEKVPYEINRYTTRITTIEYAILLQQGGQEVYDWFVKDHRFGAPPRGKAFRSNLRGEWQSKERKRPDNALSKLRQKITYQDQLGYDTSALKKELARRAWCIDHGFDWKNLNCKPPIQEITLVAPEPQSNSG